MSGDRTHAFFTAAVYDESRHPIPAGWSDDMPSAGALLFTSDGGQQLQDYDVYHSESHFGMGPLSQPYAFIGKVRDVYAERISELRVLSESCVAVEGYIDELSLDIRLLCGFSSPIHQIWTSSHVHGVVDLYMQTIGQRPPYVFAHYGLVVAEPTEWWSARSYSFLGTVPMSAWLRRSLRRSMSCYPRPPPSQR